MLLDLIPAPVRSGLLIAVVVGSSVAGWTARGWKEDAARLEAERQQAEFTRKTLEGYAAAIQYLAGERENAAQQSAKDRRNYERKLEDAKRNPQTLATCEPAADDSTRMWRPAGDVRLTAAFVGLWNDALHIGCPPAICPGQPDGADSRPDPAASITPGEVLANVAENAEVCNGLRADLMQWQAWARSIGAAK